MVYSFLHWIRMISLQTQQEIPYIWKMAWMKVDGHAQAQFSQNCRCWKAPLEIIWSKNMLRAGSMNRMPRAMLARFWISPRMETPKTKSNLFQWFLFVCFCFSFFFFFFLLFHRVLWYSQLSLYPRSTGCFHFLHMSFLPPSFTRNSLFSHAELLLPLLGYLGWTVHELEGGNAWESTHSPGEEFSRIIPLAVLPSRYLKRLKPFLLRSRAVILVFVLSFLFCF